MASTAIKAFEEFKGRNALTAAQRKNIRDRKERIRRYLADDGWVAPTAIFGGSHARRTKVRLPNDAKADVDIYIVLDPSHKSAYGGFFKPPPKQLLSDIKASLDKKLTTPTVRADSPSVRIRYDDMDVDVVPAFRRHVLFGGGLDIPYYDDWMIATPESQGAVFSKLNQKTGYRAVHIMRMLKYWKAVHPTFPLRSYHLEVLAYHVFSANAPTDYREAIAGFFEHAQSYVRYAWDDPGGSGNSVSSYMTSTQRDAAISMFSTAATRARAAIDKQTWSAEIAVWRSSGMFGTRFPAYSST